MNCKLEPGCWHHAGHSSIGMLHHQGGCCTSGYGQRRFLSREEMLDNLQEYLKQLQLEAKGVEEHIEQLKKGNR